MRVVTTREVDDLVQERGGRLFVWTRRPRCCGGTTYLETTTERPPTRPFRLVQREPFELWFAAGREPTELQVDVRSRKRRIEAFWDGCAYVV